MNFTKEQIDNWCKQNLFGPRSVGKIELELSPTQKAMKEIAVEIIQKWEEGRDNVPPPQPKKASDYEKFLDSNSGRRLLKEHSLEEMGDWNVFGEDPNCDFGGSHHEPFLATFHGKLDEVIKNAVTMPRFWTWGGGGRIEKISIKRV